MSKINKDIFLTIDKDTANYPARDVIYDFSQAYQKSMNKVHDFGNGITMTSVEAHTLKHICQNKGVTLTEIVNYWGRTKGTVSAQISNLEKKGFVYREKCKIDSKKIHILPTEAGLAVNNMHIQYDVQESLAWLEAATKKYSMDDLAKFWEMTEFYTAYLNERYK
ncbi:MAG: MarR family transcriptional regulator [Oscillospiraceae bacterium]|nr:MarR family transcriptional regulator [Oscillospiraceae bacterium]